MSRWRHGAAAAIFGLAAVALTWPLAPRFYDAIPGGGAGDNVAFVWNFWWMRHALSTGGAVFHTDHLFYPFGTDLLLNTHTALNAFAGATILRALPVVAAQNSVILAVYALNGLCAYGLAWTITRRMAAALVAGVVFMASPFFAAHLHGHFNVISAWIIPLYVMAVLQALTRRSIALGALAGAALAACAFTDYYYVIYLGAFTAAALAARWIAASVRPLAPPSPAVTDWLLALAALVIVAVAVAIRTTGGGVFRIGGATISMTSDANLRAILWIPVLVLTWRRWPFAIRVSRAAAASPRADLAIVASIAAAFAVLTTPLARLAVAQWWRGDYISQPAYWRSMPAGIDLMSLVAGNPFQPLWGGLTRRLYAAAHIDAVESVAWLGIVPITALALVLRRRRPEDSSRFWIGMAALFLMWALGPSLIVAGVRTGLWLPEVLLRFVPIASNARIPGRAMVLVHLSLAIVCAIAIARLPPARGRWLAAAACLVALLDGAAIPFPMYRVEIPAFYGELAAAPAGAILELPLGLRDGFGELGSLDHAALLYQTVHERPIAGGFVARLAPSVKARYEASAVLQALIRLSSGDAVVGAPSREEVGDFFRQWNFRFVVVSGRLTPAPLQDYVTRVMPLTLRATAGERVLYEIR